MQNNQQNQLIRAIIERKIKEGMQSQQGNTGDLLGRINGMTSKVGGLGEGLSSGGKFLNDNFASFNKLGTGMQNFGNALQNGASSIQNAIPSAIDKAITGSIGSTATSAATGATTAGTAGTASSAATFNPVGALATLGLMAIKGTNRKRAKQTNEQAQQLSEAQLNLAQNRLAQTNQIAEQIGNNNSLTNPQNDYLTQFDVDSQRMIDNYIQSNIPEQNILRASIDSYINNPNIDNQSSEASTKHKIFDNLANGIGDFISGYEENKTEAFKPENIKYDSNKGFMQRLGEGVGTAARLVQNPTVQGLIAGGLSGALSGNPLYGLGMAYKFTNNKKNSDLYKDVMSQQGINTGLSNGTISADDMAKILTTKRFQRDFLSRKDYDLMRLENGQLSMDEYNANILNPDYNPDEIININALNSISRAGRYEQENKNDRQKNYYRSKNDGKNVIKVEYGDKPDTHNYTHVTYGPKPEQNITTRVIKEKKSNTGKSNAKSSSSRVKVKSPDGKFGSIPTSQLLEAIKKGFKKI